MRSRKSQVYWRIRRFEAKQFAKFSFVRRDGFDSCQPNPANGCRVPAKEKKEMKTLAAENISAYLKAAKEWGVLPMFYLELTSGLRRGELVALLWSDVDVENRTISVTKSATRLKGEVKVTSPKTKNSIRKIILPKSTIDLLIEEHEQHPTIPIYSRRL